MRLTFVK